MDPTTTLANVASAIDARNPADAIQGMRDYANWRRKGGFYIGPDGINLDTRYHCLWSRLESSGIHYRGN